jgi:cell division control protein 6
MDGSAGAASGGDILDQIFGRAISAKTLFRDRRILTHEYVPERLPFRERQIAAIGEALSPLLRQSKCSNLLLYGKTGTGKTAVAKYVLRRLTVKARELGVRVVAAYTNTRVAGTEYRVLFELGAAVDARIPFTGLALSEVSQRVISKIEQGGFYTVFVMDEIDFLVRSAGDDLLYELTRVNERLRRGFIALIGISNDLKFKEFLDPRVLSSLSEEEVVFPPYTAEELRVILLERAKEAFMEGAVDPAAINLCAALAGAEHGDARRAVDLLRVAGEVAEREGAPRVEDKHVRLALQKIEQDRIVEALRSLPLHEKLLVLATLEAGGPSTTGQVYARYSHLCRQVGLDPLTQRRISGLLSELDLLGLLDTDVVSHGRYGRTKRIQVLIEGRLVYEIFREDPVLRGVLP